MGDEMIDERVPDGEEPDDEREPSHRTVNLTEAGA